MTEPESRDGAALILDQLGIGRVDVDLDGQILSWTSVCQYMLGYTPGEIIGNNYEVLLPQPYRDELRRALGKLRQGRRLPVLETERLHKDGSLIPVGFSIEARRGADGQLLGAYTSLADFRGEPLSPRRLRRTTAQIKAIVDTVIDGIITITGNGIIDAFNPAAERIFGYRADEVIGRNVNMLMPEPYHAEHDTYLDNYQRSGVRRIIGIGREVTARRKDGSVFPIDLSVAEMGTPESRAFVGVIRDITARKEAERALLSLNDQLSTKVAELAAALDQLQQAQEHLVQTEKLASLGTLVAGVAHEINTPVGICVTAASFLHDDTAAFDALARSGALTRSQLTDYTARARQAAALLLSNSQRASELIRSFKQVAVDRSSGEIRHFQLSEFLHDLLLSLQPALRGRALSIDIDCDTGIMLRTYPGALAQVITNLLMNAVTHAFLPQAPGTVRIEAVADAGMVRIDVVDDGIGISADNLRHIFDPFFTTARGRGGTGLGLHVTYNLVTQALGGSISAHSSPDRGARFAVRIPAEVVLPVHGIDPH